jgi:hypothetical protein
MLSSIDPALRDRFLSIAYSSSSMLPNVKPAGAPRDLLVAERVSMF